MRGREFPRKKVARTVIAVFLALVVVGLVIGGSMMVGRVQNARGLERETGMQLNSPHVVDNQSESAPGRELGCVPRADEILPVSESWSLSGLHVEKGTMNVYVDIPEPLPIYINSDVVGTWNVTYEIYGGYLPTTGYYVDVLQNGIEHQIPYSLVLVRVDPSGASIYGAVFGAFEPFYLTSDQYPLVTVAGQTFGAGHGYVPGLAVDMSWNETWTVANSSQTFTIISARIAWLLGDIAPNPLPPSPHPLTFTASGYCY
jgi:hypothetical protein